MVWIHRSSRDLSKRVQQERNTNQRVGCAARSKVFHVLFTQAEKNSAHGKCLMQHHQNVISPAFWTPLKSGHISKVDTSLKRTPL